MKKLILNILIAVLSFTVTGQKLEKYEDALPKILSSPSSGIKASMQRYIEDDPENASIYFQLGVVYYERFQNSDILTDFPYKNGTARETLKNMKTAQRVVDEKDVKKNEEHYLNFGTFDEKGRLEVAYDTIQNLINESIAETDRFIKNAPAIYESFTQSFTHYDRSHKLYTELLGKYPTINELYLLYNDDMGRVFDEISEEYSKALEAFDAYKAATDTFDIGYDQNLIIDDLVVYRLDGMSAEINFLLPEIHIWNYAKWVDETRKYIEQNIITMRQELLNEEIRTNKILSSAATDYAREEFEALDINKETLFTLRKFDLQSVIEPIFLFKESKHDLIFRDLQIKDLEINGEIDLDRKLFLYGEIINKIRKTDTLLLSIRTRNTQLTHEKYPTFLSVNYEGRTGVNTFTRSESDQLVNMQKDYEDKIIGGIMQKMSDSTDILSATYNRTSIPLIVQTNPPLEILTQDPITTHKLQNFDGSAFIGGIKMSTDTVSIAYAAGITPEGKVGWYNEYAIKLDSGRLNANNRIAEMVAIPGGCALVLHIHNDQKPEKTNQLILLNESGEEQVNVALRMPDYPQNITYNDRNNSLLITFSGKDNASDVYEAGRMTMARYNILGEKLWHKVITGRIEVVDVVTTSDGFIVMGNYSQYRSPEGRMVNAGRNNTDVGVYLMSLNNEGEITKMQEVFSLDPMYATHLIKVSDDCINIFGSTSSYQQDAPIDRSENGVYIMINRDFSELARRTSL
jgi:hypothetical protein